MKLLFDKHDKGNAEIKASLGFLDGGFNYTNIAPDVRLNTPYIIDLVGQAVYDKVADYYHSNEGSEENLELSLTYMQIFVGSIAYLDFAPDNDLQHGNNGRTFASTANEKIPWDWQIELSNSSIKRRAYKALDQLMLLLDASEWTEWTDSDQYKTANQILIKNTLAFDKIFPINKSGQLYYQLVPFMVDFEEDHICAILTKEKYEALLSEEEPEEEDLKLIRYSKQAVAYLSLGKALRTFPVEMMPTGLKYSENTSQKGKARGEVMQFLNAEGQKYLLKLENEYQQQNTTFTATDPMQGLDEDSKHVSL